MRPFRFGRICICPLYGAERRKNGGLEGFSRRQRTEGRVIHDCLVGRIRDNFLPVRYPVHQYFVVHRDDYACGRLRCGNVGLRKCALRFFRRRSLRFLCARVSVLRMCRTSSGLILVRPSLRSLAWKKPIAARLLFVGFGRRSLLGWRVPLWLAGLSGLLSTSSVMGVFILG